jgi:hypothetical protein
MYDSNYLSRTGLLCTYYISIVLYFVSDIEIDIFYYGIRANFPGLCGFFSAMIEQSPLIERS